MVAHITIWSAIGHTPRTHRIGSFCDVLVDVPVDVENPTQARERLDQLMGRTAHARTGYFIMEDWWNQNERSCWTSK